MPLALRQIGWPCLGATVGCGSKRLGPRGSDSEIAAQPQLAIGERNGVVDDDVVVVDGDVVNDLGEHRSGVLNDVGACVGFRV